MGGSFRQSCSGVATTAGAGLVCSRERMFRRASALMVLSSMASSQATVTVSDLKLQAKLLWRCHNRRGRIGLQPGEDVQEGVGANGSFFDGQFAGDCNGFKALSLDSRACHEFYVWRS